MSKYGGNNRIDFGVHFNTDKSSLAEVKKSLEQIAKIPLINFKGSSTELLKLKETVKDVSDMLDSAFNAKLNTINLDKFNTSLNNSKHSLQSIYNEFSQAGVVGQKAFSQMTSSLLTTNLQLKETHSLVNSMGKTMMNTVKWGIASSVMNNFTQSVSQAFQYVKSLDSALTDIRIVTGDSTGQMAKFADQANRAAQELGRSTMDYSKAALTFYQQGLSDEDVAARTEATLKAQNITGAGQEMANYLTAVWNGYKVANEEAELYVDKLAAVADSSASNMAQLATAMSKVASTANMLGVPVDSLNAQIATIEATTRQAPETVGNALKTIYARINDIATGAEGAQVSLGNYTSKMAELGVNVLDSNGKLRDTGDVIEEIGGKWQTLSREQQIYLARTMAGQRQYNNLLALFENWSKYTDLLNVSMNAQGTTMQKNSRYMDSLAAHMEQLGAAGERVKSAMIDSDSFKSLIDVGTGLTNLFANLIESIGGGGSALLALGGIATQVFSGVISREIHNVIQNQEIAKENMRQLAADKQLIAQFGSIKGFSDQASRTIIAQKEEISSYYNIMNTEEINSYNNLIKRIGELQTETDKYRELVDLADKLGASEENSRSWKAFDKEYDSLKQYQQGLQEAIEKLNKLNMLQPNVGKENSIQQGLSSTQLMKQFADQAKYSTGDAFWEKVATPIKIDENTTVAFDTLINKQKLSNTEAIALRDKLVEIAETIKNTHPEKYGELVEKLKYAQAETQRAIQAAKEYRQQIEKLSNVEMFTKAVGGVAQLASGFTSLLNISKVWKNENLSTGEKTLQLISAASMGIMMISSGFKNMQPVLVKIIASLSQLDAGILGTQGLSAAMKAANVSAGQLASTIGGNLLSSVTSFLATAGPYLAIIAAIGVAVYALVKSYNQASDAANRTREEADELKVEYAKTREEVNNLKSSFDNLKTAQDTLKGLIKGSEEWRSSLSDVNQQVLDLCDKFPQLIKHLNTTTDGMLYFNESEEQILKAQQQRSLTAGMAYINAENIATQASNKNIITNAARSYDNDNFVDTQVDFLKALIPGTGAKFDEFSTESVEKLIDQMKIHGDSILDNSKKLEKLGFNEKQISKIQNELKNKIIQLKNQVVENNTATKNLTDSILQSELAGNPDYESIENKEAFSKMFNNNIKEAADKINFDEGTIWTQWDSAKEYFARAKGIKAQDTSVSALSHKVTYTDTEGTEHKIKISQAKEIAQYQKALEENSDQIIKDITKTLIDVNAIFLKENQNIEKSIGQIVLNKDDIAEGKYNNLNTGAFSFESVQLIQKHAKEISETLDISEVNLKQAMQRSKDIIKKDFNDYVNSLPESIQNAFKNIGINYKTYSKDAAVAIGNILTSALVESPESLGDLEEVFKKVKPEDANEFANILGNIDWKTISLEEFQQQLKSAGIELDISNNKLLNFINILKQLQEGTVSPQDTYKALHDISDKIKTGDSIDSDQQAALQAAGVNLDYFFKTGADGLLHLRTSAEEFQQYIDNFSIQKFEEKIDEIQNKINGLNSFQNSSPYSYQEGKNNDQTWKAFTTDQNWGARGDTQLLNQQISFLQNGVNLKKEEKEIVNDINELYQQGEIISKTQGEELQNILLNHKKQWQNTSETVKNLTEESKKYKEQLDSISDALDPDIDTEQWEKLAREISKIAEGDKDEDIKGRFEISNQIKDDRQACEELAEAMLRYDHALQEVSKNYDEWKRALNSGALQDQAQAASELRNVYGDLLDISNQDFSSEFLQSADNLRLLQQAANGSEEAYNQLHNAAIEDIIMHADIDTDQFHGKAQDLVNEWNTIQASVQDLEVGAHIQDAQIYNQLNDILNATAKTSTEAAKMLDDMGFTGQIEQATVPEHQLDSWTDAVPTVTHTTIPTAGFLPILDAVGLGDLVPAEVQIPEVHYKSDTVEQARKNQKTFTTFRVKSGSLKKSAGGGFKFKNSTYGGGGKKTGSGGKKGGGGKGSSSKPSIAKKNTTKIDTKKKTQENDPYYKVNKSIEKQSKLLDDIKDQEKQLVNKDRLKNLQSQNKEIEKQLGNYQEYLSISKNVAAENSTANLRKRLQDAFGSNIGFDAEGNIADMNKVQRAAVNSYNKAATQAENTFKKVQDQYNNWILHTWNTYSKDQQEAHQKDKEAWDEKIKNAETAAKDAISAAEEEYKKKTDLIKKYQDQLKKDKEMHEKYIEQLRQIIENNLEASKIKVDLALDTGQLERDWLEFENKFIKKLDDKDILGQAAANAKELMSYFDSEEIAKTNKQIEDLYKDLNNIQNGGFSNIYGVDEKYYNGLTEAEKESLRTWGEGQLQKRLQELQEQQQESLMKMQDIINDIKDQYLDMIDEAKDQMDDHIDQYERVNDIIEHNVKLTEMLYGDKGYQTLDKYYQMQKDNNMSTLQTLKAQEAYWREQMNHEVVGSEAWKKFKENLDDAIDAVNSKLEDMLDNLAKEFENKMNAAVDRINNRLTSGLGTNYLDEQWDYLNNYDDYFLDTYNATTGIEDVTRAYQQAIDDAAANPKQQQKLNKLMNDQLKILKEKDKLTEYDLERAKSILEVEKARMALEDARNNKTKMRLRRDSQGNYTYQYVADEQKLGELQQALADAQNDLYNTDKEHYKENLNTLYDTYKEYIKKMEDLTTEYNATQDEEERARIKKRIDLLNESYDKMIEGLTEDNKYNIQYLIQSFGDGMHIDMSGLSNEEQWKVLQDNIGFTNSAIQTLSDNIVAEGGLLPATKDLIKELDDAIVQYDTDVQHILETGGTSLATISGVLDENGIPLDQNITDAQKMVEYNNQLVNATMQGVEEMQTLLSTIDEYWNKQMENIQKYVTTLQNAYDTLQMQNGSTLTSDKINVENIPLSSTIGTNPDLTFTDNLKENTNLLQEKLNSLMLEYKEFLASMGAAVFDTGGYTGIWGGDDGKIALLHQKELVLNPTDTENILAAVTAVRDATANMNITSQLDNLGNSTSNLLRNLLENSTLLDQNVHIDANFPNVNNHTQIEEAFNNLVNMAAMRASGYRD